MDAIGRWISAAAFACPAALLFAAPVMAQLGPPPGTTAAAAPGAPARNPVCVRLEGQLAAIDRGAFDPANAEQIRRYEEAAAKQQAELDRLTQQSQRLGCQGAGFFALFSGQSPQCAPLNNQMQQVRSSISSYQNEIQRLQGNSGEREGQRRGVLAALGQNDCGPQYRQYVNANQGGFFETLFGINPVPPFSSGPGMSMSGTYRTLCVRTCDGYYFPISYATVPGKFAEDEALCRRLCPATEATLYSHRNPGEDVTRAVSLTGRLYTELPSAFSYRKQLNPACSCRAPGQSWLEALRQGEDQTLERGDIVVTEERARQLSQPRFDAQGRPINPEVNPTRSPPKISAPGAGAAHEEKPEQDTGKRPVRSVGPAFFPAR